MASLQSLAEFGRALVFGGVGGVVQPATFRVPAGVSVQSGSGQDVSGWQVEAWRLSQNIHDGAVDPI